MNRVILVGFLGADPSVNETSSGNAVANLSLATSYGSGDARKTEWHKIAAFGQPAEYAATYLKKGARVLVEGRLQTSSYENKEGQTVYKTEVIASSVSGLSSSDAE